MSKHCTGPSCAKAANELLIDHISNMLQAKTLTRCVCMYIVRVTVGIKFVLNALKAQYVLTEIQGFKVDCVTGKQRRIWIAKYTGILRNSRRAKK